MKSDWFKLTIAFVLLAGLGIYFVNSSAESKREDTAMQIQEREIQLKEDAAKPNMFREFGVR